MIGFVRLVARGFARGLRVHERSIGHSHSRLAITVFDHILHLVDERRQLCNDHMIIGIGRLKVLQSAHGICAGAHKASFRRRPAEEDGGALDLVHEAPNVRDDVHTAVSTPPAVDALHPRFAGVNGQPLRAVVNLHVQLIARTQLGDDPQIDNEVVEDVHVYVCASLVSGFRRGI